jgi:hypothetical protein
MSELSNYELVVVLASGCLFVFTCVCVGLVWWETRPE